MGCAGCGRGPCSCAVLPGEGIGITGTGTPADPWVFTSSGGGGGSDIPDVFVVNEHGTPFSSEAVEAANAAAHAAGGGIVLFQIGGSYVLDTTIEVTSANVSWVAIGSAPAVIYSTVAGDAVRWHTPDRIIAGVVERSGHIQGLTFDGSFAPAGAVGVHWGDLLSLTLQDLQFQHWNLTGSIACWADSEKAWTEGCIIDGVTFVDNTINLCFDSTTETWAAATPYPADTVILEAGIHYHTVGGDPGTAVFNSGGAWTQFYTGPPSFKDLKMIGVRWIINAGQIGVLIRNGANIYDALLDWGANIAAGGPPEAYFLKIEGTGGSAGQSGGIQTSLFNVTVETDGSGAAPFIVSILDGAIIGGYGLFNGATSFSVSPTGEFDGSSEVLFDGQINMPNIIGAGGMYAGNNGLTIGGGLSNATSPSVSQDSINFGLVFASVFGHTGSYQQWKPNGNASGVGAMTLDTNGTLVTTGGICRAPVAAETTDYLMTLGDDTLLFTLSASATVTLLAAAASEYFGFEGKHIIVSNLLTSTAPLTIASAGADLAPEVPTVLPPGASVEVVSDGTNWHRVSQTGPGDWRAPAFVNSWADAGGFGAASYRLEGTDVVRLEGAVTGGISGSVMFTLPVGYRPSVARIVATPDVTGAGVNFLSVATSGDVTATGTVTFVFLDGCTFTL